MGLGHVQVGPDGKLVFSPFGMVAATINYECDVHSDLQDSPDVEGLVVWFQGELSFHLDWLD